MNQKYEDIAIIGIDFKLPKAENESELLDILYNAKDCMDSLNEKRRELAKGFFTMGTPVFEKACYLEDINGFDYKFFNLSYEEALLMDPAQRLLLQSVYHCIENAGYNVDELSGMQTGLVIAYGSNYDYKEMIQSLKGQNVNNYSPSFLTAFAASRIAYCFNLKGPSLTIDTTCSSSLTALHLACSLILNGECSYGIVSSAQLFHQPVWRGDIGIQSKSKKTKIFDAEADGTVCAEGLCSIIIKKLEYAIKDKDYIYAVIKGSAINSDGKTANITTPSSLSQSDVIMRAWESAQINPETLTYIEAHGTGTKLGDPIELNALDTAFRKYTKKQKFCGVGSIKSNLGHLGYSAGLAGVIKCILQFQKHTLFKTANFSILNPFINLKDSAIYVCDQTVEWKSDRKRRCGVSSFGISGSNCHMILEEYIPPSSGPINEDYQIDVLILSAKKNKSLKENIQKAYQFLKNKQADIMNVCYTYNSKAIYGHQVLIHFDTYYNLLERLLIAKNLYNTEDICFFELDEKVLKKIAYPGRKSFVEVCKDYSNGLTYDWKRGFWEIYRKIPTPKYFFDSTLCSMEAPLNDIMPDTVLDLKKITNYLEVLNKYDRYRKTEIILALLIYQITNIKNIDINTDIRSYGLDSLVISVLINEINRLYNLELTDELLENTFSLYLLGKYIDNVRGDNL